MATGRVAEATDLPPALAAWSGELSLFPRELALHLGAVVRRIASLIGEALPSRQGSGDPDGFEGLARRGPYDRLLQSEWLFADELPDEFARRAVMHEHLFLELARQHPVQHPLSVALFDCGPSQIGAPRLVHIAALVVLARRAAASQATFRWGLLQHPGFGLIDGVTKVNIHRLLAAHTHAETTEAMLDAWGEALAAGDKVGELWFVGPKRLGRFPAVRRQWQLVTDDVLVPEARQVSASVRHDSRNDPPALLELPPAESCVRLLRDPFEASAARPTPVSSSMAIVSNILFGNGGRVLLGRARNGDLIVQPYSNSARPKAQAQVPKARRIAIPAGTTLIAGGWHKGRDPLFLLSAAEGIRVCRGSSSHWRRSQWPKGGILPAVGSPEEPGQLQPCLSHGDGVAFLDHHGTLWNVTATGMIEQLTTEVRAVRREHGRLRYIRRGENDWVVDSAHRITLPGTSAYYGLGVYAVEQRDRSWRVGTTTKQESATPPAGATVIGVAAAGVTYGWPALIAIEADGRSVIAVRKDTTVAIVRTASMIVDAAVSSISPHLAVRLDSGDIEVYSLKNRQRMFQSVLEEGPS
jgi:hypothetical protein